MPTSGSSISARRSTIARRRDPVGRPDSRRQARRLPDSASRSRPSWPRPAPRSSAASGRSWKSADPTTSRSKSTSSSGPSRTPRLTNSGNRETGDEVFDRVGYPTRSIFRVPSPARFFETSIRAENASAGASFHDRRSTSRDLSGRAARGDGSRGDSEPDEGRPRGRRGSGGRRRGRLSRRRIRRARGQDPAGARRGLRAADIILQVLCHGSNDATGKEDLPLLRRDQVLIGFLRPLGSIETIREIAERGVTSFSVELMPRTTRAQSMDALSSMATICGYKAVVVAADLLPRLFPMLTTAAGTITPARVLVIGAGVAGLQAIATARRLGAVVSAYDLRPAAKEQVQSLGGRFVELPIEAKDAQDARGYARAQDETFLRAPARAAGAGRRRERRRHHGRGDPGQEIAGAGHARDGRAHGARLGDRRPGRGARRELRADSPGRAASSSTASPSSAGSTWPAPCPTTPARCTRET